MSSAGGEKFYDSQSGREMTVPGSAGVRIHELSPRFAAANNNADGLLPAIAVIARSTKATSVEVATLSNEVMDTLLLPTSGRGWTGSVAIPVLTVDAVAALQGVLARVRETGGGGVNPSRSVEAVVELVLDADPSKMAETLETSEAIVAAAARAGLRSRVVILDAFDTDAEGDLDVNTRQDTLEATIARMADAEGAATITLADTLGRANEETMREGVEAAFYLDVEGARDPSVHSRPHVFARLS